MAELAPLLRDVLAAGTLYDFARRQPEAQALAGRQPAFAISTPTGAGAMVVRHNRHGGLFARLTGDRFLPPTRAPREFDLSARLRAAGVPTPPILAYVVYRDGLVGALRRGHAHGRRVPAISPPCWRPETRPAEIAPSILPPP